MASKPTRKVRELETQLAAAENAQRTVDLLNDLALELRFTDLQKAIELSEQAAELSSKGEFEKNPYNKGTATSYYNLGIFSLQKGAYHQASSYLFKSLLAAEVIGDQLHGAQVLYYLGEMYLKLNDYPNALDYFLRVNDIATEIGDAGLDAQALNSIGNLYMQLGDWAKALSYLQRSLDISKRLESVSLQALTLDNSGICYCRLGNYDLATTYCQESLQLFRSIGAQHGEARALTSLGEIYRAQGDYTPALECFNKVMAMADRLDLKHEVVDILQSISLICRTQGDLPGAVMHLEQALALAQELKTSREQYQCHQALAEVFRQMGNFAKALTHYEQYHLLREDVFNEEADQRIKSLGAIQEVEMARKTAELYQVKNVALQQEVNDRRKAEEALQVANAQLQSEIGEREKLISDLNAFSHMVAHDLKTPLTAINMYTYLLSKKLTNVVDIDVLRFIEIIDQTTARMGRIVDELLMLSSVRQEDVVSMPIDMGDIVHEVEKRLQYMIQQYEARVVYPAEWPVAMGHAQWIEEVWDNYISNAIKYGGTPPLIELGATQVIGGKVRFWVRDNGTGLSLDDQAKLFMQFTRLDKTRATGYGLGLSIVKRIVEKLGGEVGLESEGVPGRGSTFSFTLPAVSPDKVIFS